jgi:flagellar motor switch/type III secretory pathway protein FliN
VGGPSASESDALALLLAPGGDGRRFLVEVEGALGALLVSRALRQRAPRITDPSRPPAATLLGAFAAVMTAALRGAHAGVVLKVLAAGPAAALARDLAAGGTATTAWLTVRVGEGAFEARVTVPDDLFAPAALFTYSDLRALGDAPLALPLVIASTLASRADLDTLSSGDAFVFAATASLAAGELNGAVALVAPQGERGIAANLAAEGRLVVRGQIESHPWEREMSSDERSTTILDVLQDAPVVVRVELGKVEMTARDWAALGPGDIVTLGRKIGDPAILRVGGAELARGELVQVEGEMAVRITARATREGERG